MTYSEFGDNAKSYVEKILAILDIEATVLQEEVDESTICYRIECRADDARILIGRNGQTLDAMQFVVRQMCRSAMADQPPFVIDILDYRSRRKRSLEEQAKRAAVEVLNGESDKFALLPMSPYERRIVHQFLHDEFPDLASESEGDGPDRHIVISYKGLPGDRRVEERHMQKPDQATDDDSSRGARGERPNSEAIDEE